MSTVPHILVIEARFYEDLAEALYEGAADVLEREGAKISRLAVPGVLEIPAALSMALTAMENGEADWGILICGSANGVAMTANKHQKVRAGLCWTKEIVELIRQHNDANVLCIPARFTAIPQAVAMVKIFLATDFEGGRHQRRVDKISC